MPQQKKGQIDTGAGTNPVTEAPAPSVIEEKQAPKRRRPAKAAPPVPAAEPVADDSGVVAEPVAAEPQEEPLISLLEVGLKKKERSETHDKDRVYIRKDLKARLDAVAEGRGKGFKTLLLNYGLEKALEELESAEAKTKEEA
ncbi:hypothetical protein RAC89_13700 [Paenibacillus sp. GD4]|uniref:hypothetical protein n=1 Tax=Paenibacillus sp. GD4 TaxID=3068890 RepID=UPI0027966CFC|nr:hypothetical protein [Paenibacillus sp. GD4]MDQ1911490.1 hypothetical protein [Paenibacillus sp. GD4]